MTEVHPARPRHFSNCPFWKSMCFDFGALNSISGGLWRNCIIKLVQLVSSLTFGEYKYKWINFTRKTACSITASLLPEASWGWDAVSCAYRQPGTDAHLRVGREEGVNASPSLRYPMHLMLYHIWGFLQNVPRFLSLFAPLTAPLLLSTGANTELW